MTASVWIGPELHIKLFHEYAKFKKFLNKRGFPCEPAYGEEIKYESGDGYCKIAILIDPGSDTSLSEQIAILAHEATHAVDDYLKYLNENPIGEEHRAYLMQGVMTYLVKERLEYLGIPNNISDILLMPKIKANGELESSDEDTN